jgi:hypothetical protein
LGLANFLQCLFAQQVGIAFTGCCEIDDLVGYRLFDVIVAVSNPQGDAHHFECDELCAKVGDGMKG